LRSPRWTALWIAAAFVSLATAVALGLRALAGDVESARSRYAEQAAALARAVVSALEGEGRRAEPGSSAVLEFRATAEGRLLGPAPPERAPSPASDKSLREYLEHDVDALELEGRGPDAEQRLREIASGDKEPDLAAWARTWLAARAAREGRVEDARAAWKAIVDDSPDQRDEQGLKRSFAARFRLAETESSPASVTELERLHEELCADRASLDDTATASLALRITELVRARAPGREAELLRSASERTRVLRFVASWPTGISDWIARGAPGGARTFDLALDPLDAEQILDRALVSAAREGDEWRGVVLELATLATRALAQPEVATRRELGFEAAIEDSHGRVLAGRPPSGDAPVATDRAHEPLAELSVRAWGTDFAGFVAAERRRFGFVAVLAIAALVAGAVAGGATIRAIRREARSAREREDFVAAVTHELKTPLASIRLFAELLERGDVDPVKVREFGTRTVAETERLSRLVDGVLRFAELRGGTGDGAALPSVDLREVARLAVASVEPIARERGFEIAVNAPAGLLPVKGDRDALVGAVAELLDNATKYGGAPHAIELVIERRGDRAGIAVLDRGPGVPEAERERIFEPFHRAGDELTRERTGVGLGLALVRGAADSHHGRARYAPREGGGSRFEIELPLGA
jgi:signal transduction histidine kinase